MLSEADKNDIEQAAKVVLNGGVILYPTDTVWGIGCDANNDEAVKRIYSIKNRINSKAMIVLVDGYSTLQNIVSPIPPIATKILQSGSIPELSSKDAQRPITIVYPHAKDVSPLLLAEDGSLGIRITNEEYSQALCRKIGRPLVSTSANISGTATPSCFANIDETIKQAVDYVCLGRREYKNSMQHSIIIKLEGTHYSLIRT